MKISDFASMAAYFSNVADPGAMLIVPGYDDVIRVRALLEHQSHRVMRVFAPSPANLAGWAAPMTIIHPNVGLYEPIGETPLLALVRQRMQTFKSPAIILL